MERIITYQALLLMSQDEKISKDLRENYNRVLKFLSNFFNCDDVMIEEVNRYGLLRQLENGRVFYSETGPIFYNIKDLMDYKEQF